MVYQVTKGELELCALCLLERRDMYGYEILSVISPVSGTSEGSLYPLLKKMKADGLVQTYLKESPDGPPRKYYAITEDGTLRKKELKSDWESFVYALQKIID